MNYLPSNLKLDLLNFSSKSFNLLFKNAICSLVALVSFLNSKYNTAKNMINANIVGAIKYMRYADINENIAVAISSTILLFIYIKISGGH